VVVVVVGPGEGPAGEDLLVVAIVEMVLVEGEVLEEPVFAEREAKMVEAVDKIAEEVGITAFVAPEEVDKELHQMDGPPLDNNLAEVAIVPYLVYP
jgi:hypothetical protein